MKRTKIVATASVAACLTCAFAASVCIVGTSGNSAKAEPFTYEVFDYVDCYADTNRRVPESTGIDYARRGLKVTAQKSGAAATLKTDVAGVFDFEFLPYSANGFGGSDYETAAFENSYQDIRAMSLVFTDKADETKSFTLKLTGGAAGNNVTVNASVIYDDAQAGVYYYRDNVAYGSTSGNNANGVYTFLYGTSFNNTAVGAGVYSARNVHPVRIVFDPSEMCVYGYNYGYAVSLAEKRLIWDFTKSNNDGKDLGATLDGFDSYSVKMVFDEIKSGSEGNLIAYSLNGCDLSGSVLNSVGPTCYVRNVPAVKQGEALNIPTPICYDPVGGTSEFAGKVKLVAPNGGAVKLAGKADSDGFYDFTTGMSVTLEESGEYALTYKAKNSSGKFGAEYTVAVKSTGSGYASLKLSNNGGSHYLSKGDNLTPDTGVFVDNGVEHTATFKVYDPTGAEVAAPYTMTKDGRYTVRYSATVGDKTYTADAIYYSLNSNASLFTGGSTVSITPATSELHSELKGLKAESVVNNGVITYSNPISIKNKTSADTLIRLMALPKKYGAAAFGQMAITLTDKANAQNYVTVLITPGATNDISTVRAASANQTFSGLNGSGNIESFSGGGTPVLHSFYGVSNYANITEQFIDLRLDYGTKRIYMGNKLVCDLDDSEHFISAWDGFESDEVELTVTLRDIYGDSAAVLIDEVDGRKIAESYYRDCVSPTVVAAYDESDTPTAVVGQKFPVLAVTVTDNMDASPSCTVAVTDGNGNEVDVEGGAFVPTAVGRYKMTFTATDYTGNSVTREFTVNAVTQVPPLAISPNGDVKTSAKVGEILRIPSANVTGGCGQNKINITVEGRTTDTKYTVEGGTVKITVADTFDIVYTVTDYLGNKAEYKSELVSELSDEPVFEEIPDMPNIFIAGRVYTLPTVAAYDYKANKAATVEISVSVDGGAPTKLNGNTYLPVLSAAKSVVTVKYTAISADGNKTEMSFDVTAVDLYNDEGDLDLTRYFVTENVEGVTANDDCTSFAIADSDAKISFVKEVYAHGFELMFDVPSAANNADSIVITMTDAADPSKRVVFEAVKGGFADLSTRVKINGTQDITISGNFFDAIPHMRISYANDSYAITDATGLSVGYVKTYLDGTQFRGFSDTVNFDITFKNVSGVFRFDIYRVGNQLMMENDGDYTQPVIVTDGEMLRQLRRGEQLTVVKAKAFDVLGFETTLTVSVRSENKTLLEDAPCDREYVLTLDEYGEYFVVFCAEDENYNVNNYTLVVNVRDDTPPEIKVDRTERTVRVGSPFNIATATYTDDEEVAATFVFVIDTDNNMINVTGEKTFTPTKKGIYTVRYVARDEAGNIGFVDVTVKAAD